VLPSWKGTYWRRQVPSWQILCEFRGSGDGSSPSLFASLCFLLFHHQATLLLRRPQSHVTVLAGQNPLSLELRLNAWQVSQRGTPSDARNEKFNALASWARFTESSLTKAVLLLYVLISIHISPSLLQAVLKISQKILQVFWFHSSLMERPWLYCSNNIHKKVTNHEVLNVLNYFLSYSLTPVNIFSTLLLKLTRSAFHVAPRLRTQGWWGGSSLFHTSSRHVSQLFNEYIYFVPCAYVLYTEPFFPP
jgi:hypothetical protein